MSMLANQLGISRNQSSHSAEIGARHLARPAAAGFAGEADSGGAAGSAFASGADCTSGLAAEALSGKGDAHGDLRTEDAVGDAPTCSISSAPELTADGDAIFCTLFRRGWPPRIDDEESPYSIADYHWMRTFITDGW
jgi:hypothetical protein